jgi:hypothetical protein
MARAPRCGTTLSHAAFLARGGTVVATDAAHALLLLIKKLGGMLLLLLGCLGAALGAARESPSLVVAGVVALALGLLLLFLKIRRRNPEG